MKLSQDLLWFSCPFSHFMVATLGLEIYIVKPDFISFGSLNLGSHTCKANICKILFPHTILQTHFLFSLRALWFEKLFDLPILSDIISFYYPFTTYKVWKEEPENRLPQDNTDNYSWWQRKQLRGVSLRGMDTENVVHLQNGILLSYPKKNAFMKFIGKWLELEDTILSEVTQSQKKKTWYALIDKWLLAQILDLP